MRIEMEHINERKRRKAERDAEKEKQASNVRTAEHIGISIGNSGSSAGASGVGVGALNKSVDRTNSRTVDVTGEGGNVKPNNVRERATSNDSIVSDSSSVELSSLHSSENSNFENIDTMQNVHNQRTQSVRRTEEASRNFEKYSSKGSAYGSSDSGSVSWYE